MYGFSIAMNGRTAATVGDICYKNVVCRNHMINKFEHDKLFAETDRYIFMLDGVVLIRKELAGSGLMGGGNAQWLNKLLGLYQEEGDLFFKCLRGSFAGALFDKERERWIIFGDQIGSRFIYYAHVGNLFVCSEVMGHVYDMLRDNGVAYHFDETGALMLLTYGFMLDGVTLCQEVRKINPGCYITVENGRIEERRYYLLDNTPDSSIHEADAIEMVDHYFRQAVQREFDKDLEYGYKHLVALSGGLDCRMTSFVAHDMGYTTQLNYTFSQTGYWDQTLPQRMAAFLQHEWIFKALDNGLWLMDADGVTRTTGGNTFYYGNAHSNDLFRNLNFGALGVAHSGQLGDVVLSSCVKKGDENTSYKVGEGAYSQKYVQELSSFKASYEYPNKEIGRFYYRFFNGTNNGLQTTYNYTESLSPFLDLDFLEKMMSIPVELRQNHYLYKKWILAHYPRAARFEWESIGCKITDPMLKLGNHELPWRNVPGSVMAHVRMALGIRRQNSNSTWGMHPMAQYLAHNDRLRQYFDDYFAQADQLLTGKPLAIVQDFSHNGTPTEKIQAISLLSAVRLYFN